MKTLKINVNNETAIQAVLDEVQRRASARTVSYKDVIDLKNNLSGKLEKFNVPKKLWKGCDVVFAEYVNCNAYSNRGSRNADSTWVRVTCTGKDFFLTSCSRVSLPTARNNNDDYKFHFTKEAAEAGMKNMYKKSSVVIL